MKKTQADILGELVQCPKFSNAETGGGIINLEECAKCEHYKGVDLVRPANKEKSQLEINNVICGLPTQVRISYHLGGIE